MTTDSINKSKKIAYNAIFISMLITAVIVFLKLHMTRTEGRLTLLLLTLSPYGFLAITACVVSEQRDLRTIWRLSYANCIIGSIAYIILHPSSPTRGAGGGASMAALIFFFVTFVQLLLVAVFSIVFAISKSAKAKQSTNKGP